MSFANKACRESLHERHQAVLQNQDSAKAAGLLFNLDNKLSQAANFFSGELPIDWFELMIAPQWHQHNPLELLIQ